jgi:hypothetical protein
MIIDADPVPAASTSVDSTSNVAATIRISRAFSKEHATERKPLIILAMQVLLRDADEASVKQVD